MNHNDGGILGEVCFRQNKDGWILLSERLGRKVEVQCTYDPKKFKRASNPRNQHRMFFGILDTSVQVRPKLAIDISKFTRATS